MTLISRYVFLDNKKNTLQHSSGKITIAEISVVLPVKDNQKGIDLYLDTFFLTHQREHFPREFIIVDNNSFPPIHIKDRHRKSGIIKLLSCKAPGPAAARNLGAMNAIGQWLLFNDSDCLPTASFLTGYLKASNGSVAYAGNIKSLGKDRLSRYYESQEILIPLKVRTAEGRFAPQYLVTANSLVWKQAFIQVKGFNECIKIAGGEDVDFGLKLAQIGNLSYAFESVILHDFGDGIKGFFKRFIRYGEGNRIVEELWQTNMRPKPFRPNTRTLYNKIASIFQFTLLLYGYLMVDRKIKKQKLNVAAGKPFSHSVAGLGN